ncbi:unnamed protein product [Callosobruchus maculatus]|uniref:Uncharacterized protein n=1 Tax=Callosobruchus maculatus TaxID=64391 RepID=A0A653D2K8_CALMS|nr:unnamed protein product [Callosobruchus maculatus]
MQNKLRPRMVDAIANHKVRHDSSYDAIEEPVDQDEKPADNNYWYRWFCNISYCCCKIYPEDSEDQDLQLSLLEYVKEVRSSTPEGCKRPRHIIVPLTVLLNREQHTQRTHSKLVKQEKQSRAAVAASREALDQNETGSEEQTGTWPITSLRTAEEDRNGGLNFEDDVSLNDPPRSPCATPIGSSKSATPSPVATAANREWHTDDDIDRLLGIHTRTSLSSLGVSLIRPLRKL